MIHDLFSSNSVEEWRSQVKIRRSSLTTHGAVEDNYILLARWIILTYLHTSCLWAVNALFYFMWKRLVQQIEVIVLSFEIKMWVHLSTLEKVCEYSSSHTLRVAHVFIFTLKSFSMFYYELIMHKITNQKFLIFFQYEN